MKAPNDSSPGGLAGTQEDEDITEKSAKADPFGRSLGQVAIPLDVELIDIVAPRR